MISQDATRPTLCAVVYARYSTDLQSAASIEDQVRMCCATIEEHGWKYLRFYADRAMSGASAMRPGYQQLIEDAQTGRFDVIVAEGLDRLTRDQAEIAALYKQMSFRGIKLVTLAEGEVTELHVGLKGTMNALFLKDLAQKTRRGLRGRIEAGRSGGGLCYGYDVSSEPSPNERKGGRQINLAQAQVVRRIFNAFASGKSPRRIAFELNRENVASPGKKEWSASTINGNAERGTGIINNELYAGRLVWNRLRYVKDPISGRRVSRINPRSEWITRNVPELRIVDPDLWDAVKGRQASLRKNTRPDCHDNRPFWTKTRPKYLLSGLMHCGACGGAYTKINANLFGCAAARNKGTCFNRMNVRTDKIEAIVLDALKHQMMDPELFKIFADELALEIERLGAADAQEANQLKNELANVDRRLGRIVAAIADGFADRALKEQLAALEAQREDLEERLSLAFPRPLTIPANIAGLYRRKIEELDHALANEKTGGEAKEVIRGLIEAIVLVPDDGKLRVGVKAELASILALSGGGKKPGADDVALAKQIKVVAGVGFEPTTFRL